MVYIAKKEYYMASNIKELFSEYKKMEIPPYQRAYSWGEEQWEQFLDDLNEQKDNGKYYLGQFIFETENQNSAFFVIDGQQRLTTILILFSVIIEYLEKSNSNMQKDISNNSRSYLKALKTIKDDQPVFEKILFDNLRKLDKPETISQGNLVKAATYFSKKIAKTDVETVYKIVNTLENASVTIQLVGDRLLATQIFEYQNNRGKDLSEFEIIKAYLLQQIYANNTDRIISDKIVNEIQEKYISRAFRYIESVEEYFSESELLNITCYLFCDGNDGDIDSIKEQLKGIKGADGKISWIQTFFEKFCDIAFSAKNITDNLNEYILNLFLLGNRVNWKLVLLAIYHRNENSHDRFEQIVKALNVLTFKMLLTGYRADYLKNYVWRYYDLDDEYTIDGLYEDIRNVAINGFIWYWNNENAFVNLIKEYFENDKYHYSKSNIVKFVLWNYENSLLKKENAGFLQDKDRYKKYTIEHIHPENPEKEDSEYFKTNYLHIIGNLNLLTQSQNSSFGRKDFDKKKELYQKTALISYTEIRKNKHWTKVEIGERNKRITSFVINYFKDML
jgi:uncharacterized protein with ParB-like and HNH nuclease domain